MPDFPIIDSHIHLYNPGEIRFDWMTGVPKLNAPHLPADFNRLSAGVDVESLIFVEVDAAPGEHLREAKWIENLARQEPRIKAMVGHLPLHLGTRVENDMAAFAMMPLARSVRQLIQSHVDEPGWCLREPFVEAVQLLPKHGLTFDLCVLHPQMGDIVELCRRSPAVEFVLDHIGKPGISAGLVEPWKAQLAELARLPNVSCKISGVATEAHHGSWTEAQLTPYIQHAINCFGFDRAMFGGDWPVSELATTYLRWVKLVDDVTSGASQKEKRQLFRETARRFYRF